MSDLCEETFNKEHHRARTRWNFDVITDKPVEKSNRTIEWYTLDDDTTLENSYFCGISSTRSSGLRNSVSSTSSSTSSTSTSLYDDNCFDEAAENTGKETDSNS